ncbi:Glycosyltransferase involved in cell wall bisynthesis [Opitutus sp. GAS368]|nr:glycosyltransferase [Opitutus sp. GAS368]SDS13402.1 Glycosyltransferase involved in cell wall bisynthesis [Opitutus sp. GAS368]
MAPPTHLVLLPTYNTGPRLHAVVAEVLRHWPHVLVVVDGSTDGSDRLLREQAGFDPALTVLVLPRNSGKGAAVLAGAQAAVARGFTHALVMDADGQHPAGSIGEFMAASQVNPAALVLGRPIFPANIPAERLHGRKLSVGLVQLELLGAGVADPLFGFRVYPLAPLLAVLGSRRGGRRYDFDTEAAVRLAWAGVPPQNLAAPVRYFSRAEGGVSHFHYVRDNATLVWLHTRLLVELLFWRWPALLRHRRQWRTVVATLAVLLWTMPGAAAEPDELVTPAHRLAAATPAWRDLADLFAHQPDTAADFTERRQFPFKREPVELQGEARVSAARGLSLHYTSPEDRTVILDAQGLLIRARTGEKSPPADPRATAANGALRHLLRFEFAALEPDFELYGRRDGDSWILALAPRTDLLRQSIGRITVAGEAAAVRRIELRRSARQVIEILIAPPHPPADFTAEEVKKYFR